MVYVIVQSCEMAGVPVPGKGKAHQIRVVAASTAFLRGFSLKQVLEAASWASENTF
jgi:hypothetical protein